MAKKNIKTHAKKKNAKILVDQKKYTEARALFEKICEIDKRDADAWYMLGTINGILGCKEQSINSLEQSIQLRPRHALSYYNLGISYRDLGRNKEAIEYFLKAIEIKSDYIDAYKSLSQILIDDKQLDRSVEILRQLIKLEPNVPQHRHNLATVLQFMGVVDEAIESYRQALNLDSEMTMVWDGLGNALSDTGRFEEAIQAYRQSLKIDPNNASAHSNLLLTLNYMENFTPQEVYKEHKAWGEQHGNKTINPIETGFIESHLIRIGYISPDFREHSVSYFIEPLFEEHDDEFEITCYSSVPHALSDNTTDYLKSLTTRWRDISNQSDDQIIKQIRKDKIDILVDLSGHTANNHLNVFAKKPAPIQITWLGYPNTTGLQTIDYRIVDNITDPEGADNYCTEKMMHMPGCFVCYKPPKSAPNIKPIAYEENGYITFGSFNNLSKIGENVIRAWAELLLRIPDARLLIKNPSLTDKLTKAKYHQYFLNLGIDIERIILMGHTSTRYEHLDLYNQIDIALDTFPYNGTTTTCEALWMGVPVIALIGDRHAARVSASLLTNIGFEELIASNIEEYVSLAEGLAYDLNKLKMLRSELRSRMTSSDLCNSTVFTKQFEQACLNALRQNMSE